MDKKSYDPIAFQRVIEEGKIWIKPETYGLVQFKPNALQKKMIAYVARCRSERVTIGSRAIVLKCRQPGATTGVCSILLPEHKEQPTHDSLVAAHAKDTTDGIWNMYRRANLYYGLEQIRDLEDRKEKRGARKNDNFLQHPDTGSRIYIERADADLARGRNVLHVHLSEIDYWDSWHEPWASLQPCIVRDPMSICFLETTLEDRTASEWRDYIAGARAGENVFDIIFLPWYEVERYSHVLTDEAERELEAQLTDEEKEIIQIYDLSLGQIAWRRETIRELNGNVKRFRQTYPISIDEALESKSEGFYQRDALKWHEERLRGPIDRVHPELMGNRSHMRKFGIIGEAQLEIFERPIGGHRYTIGCDCADAEQAGTLGSENYLVVVDTHRGTQVAQWHAHTNLYEFAEVIVATAMYYNNALLNIEANQGGTTVINRIHKDLQYHNIAVRKSFDRRTQTETELLGFRTDKRTRELLLDLLRECVNTGKTNILDQYQFEQHRAFSARNALQQKRQARGAVKDDGPIAHGLALIACPQHERDKWVETRNITNDALSEQGLLDNKHPGIMIVDWKSEERRWNRAREDEAYGDLF